MADPTYCILATGVNHRTAPVEVRERLAFGPGKLRPALAALRDLPAVTEACILSTCNRAELYVVGPEPDLARREVLAFLGEFQGIQPDDLTAHLYHHFDGEAARHLFRVAAGVDSMVTGESEILAQVKQALQQATEAGTTRAFLNELFQRSLHVGKRARSETGVHRGAVSVGSAAVELALNVFGSLAGKKVLIIGAGEMSRQMLQHLVCCGMSSVIVANRTHERALELAGEFGGEAVKFDDFPSRLAEADVVLASSAAPHAIVTPERLREPLARRRGRPLFMIDIAVPRDIDPAVAELPNVYLFDIDDLTAVTNRYRQEREREAAEVERLVDGEVDQFLSWLGSRGVTPTIRELRERTDQLRDEEAERWLRKLPDLSPAEREVVERMLESFANKLLHAPLTRLRKLADGPRGAEQLHVARTLFGLDDESERRSRR